MIQENHEFLEVEQEEDTLHKTPTAARKAKETNRIYWLKVNSVNNNIKTP